MQDTCAIDVSVLEQIREIQPPGEDLVGKIIRLFIDESTRLRRHIEEAVSESNCEAVQQYAHSLKSCSANVGAMNLSARSHEMESAGRDAEDERLSELLPSLVGDLEQAIIELEALQANA